MSNYNIATPKGKIKKIEPKEEDDFIYIWGKKVKIKDLKR